MGKPYTYLIGWSNQRMYYYGVRFAHNCSPEDLWVTYFTSSKSVRSYRDKHGDPDIIQIRKVFECSNQARAWEDKLLKRINASGREDFLNKANGTAIINDSEHYKKLSERLKGLPKTKDHRSKLRGRRPHVNQRGVNNNAFRGFVITPYGRFENLHDAAKIESVHCSTIAWRINSDNFQEYMRETI